MSYLAIPEIGLTSVFIVCFVSATLLPMGSEPAVFAVVASSPSMFWPVMIVATIGNTLGGILNYWIGYGAKEAFAREKNTLVRLAGKIRCQDHVAGMDARDR